MANNRESYSRLDMVRIAKLTKEHPALSNLELVKLFDQKFPQRSEAEKKQNVKIWWDSIDKLIKE